MSQGFFGGPEGQDMGSGMGLFSETHETWLFVYAIQVKSKKSNDTDYRRIFNICGSF